VAARVPDNKVDSELAALLEVTSSPEVLKLERERTAAKQKQEEEALNASAAAAEQQRREAAQRAEEAKAQAQKDIARIMGQQRRR
jgi:triphosphoribosyl-dephospho-CoA synthetase